MDKAWCEGSSDKWKKGEIEERGIWETEQLEGAPAEKRVRTDEGQTLFSRTEVECQGSPDRRAGLL